MLDKKLEKYFKRIDKDSHVVLNTALKSSINDFILDTDRIKDPYKFAHHNKLDVETALQLFLYFTDGNPAPLNMLMYVDCQELDCKSPIYLDEWQSHDYIACLHCAEQYLKEDIMRMVKVKFIKNDEFFITKPPTCTYDILTRSDSGLKPSPAIFQSPSIAQDEMKKNIAGIPLDTLTTLNTTSKKEAISKPLSELDERLSRSMMDFKIT
ncbi:hypothetical protein [Sporosarcina sp. P17b]|uniref:hypothetical protein n=1 Tax=Sporosarcina sp. P17b TaxID=2048260 RepID=UPI000C16292F|nr:hypothetical protein [Sporosarcina sp. P17b]PIC72484.1 hypothetical protein CSV76_14735 [Sporosarcina sp. P17b]